MSNKYERNRSHPGRFLMTVPLTFYGPQNMDHIPPFPIRLHCKKQWRIINRHYAFMTVKLVNERNLPFHKPFLIVEVGEGLCPVANSYTLVLFSLFINSFCIDQRNPPLRDVFIRSDDKLCIWRLIPLIFVKRDYERKKSKRVYKFGEHDDCM